MEYVYALLEEYEYDGHAYVTRIHTVGVYDSLEKAKEALQRITRAPTNEYWVEEWPLNEEKTRFNVMVVATEDSIENSNSTESGPTP